MKRVLVIGDVISDVYTECYFKKMCPDAPDVRALVRMEEEIYPGGAANVAMNLVALSPDTIVDLIGVIDYDLARDIKRMSRNRVCMEYAYAVDKCASLRKERFVLDGRSVLRVDQLECHWDNVLRELGARLECYKEDCTPDLVILSDYGGGLLRMYREWILQYRDRLLVDTKEKDLSVFDGCLAIKLNREELRAISEFESTPESYCKGLVTTLGEDGAVLHMLGKHPRYPNVTITHTLSVRGHLPIGTKGLDPCGCGDTFLAGMAASLLRNDDMFSAVQFGNAAAATVVTEPRVAVADLGRTLGLLGRESDEVGTGRPYRDHRDTP